jgi:hypothetical protein
VVSGVVVEEEGVVLEQAEVWDFVAGKEKAQS